MQRKRKRAVATRLAQAIQPAAERLRTFDGLDPLADQWPDYRTTFEAVAALQEPLYEAGLFGLPPDGLYFDAEAVLSLCLLVWIAAHKTVAACLESRPDEYWTADERIKIAMMGACEEGRSELASLATTLRTWDGDGVLRFPTDFELAGLMTSAEEFVRMVMLMPSSMSNRLQRLDALVGSGEMTKEAANAEKRRILERGIEIAPVRPPVSPATSRPAGGGATQ